jgi:hypothetical protein
MNELRKDVTDYDISDKKKRKFFIYVCFHKVGEKEQRHGAGLLFRFGLAHCRSILVKKGRLFRIAQF